MPEAVNMPTKDGTWKGWTLSVLNGNEIRVRPEIYAVMQEILSGDGEPTVLAYQALARTGLTKDEIAARTFQETKIVVDYDLAVT